MKQENRFSGHLDPEDPRNLLSLSKGCTWPTMSPMRWHFAAESASGQLSFLKSRGVLFEVRESDFYINFATYDAVSLPEVVNTGFIFRNAVRQVEYFRWTIMLIGFDPIQALFIEIDKTFGHPCNTSVFMDDVGLQPIGTGFAEGLVLRQVEWNQTRPPGWTGSDEPT